MTYLWTLYPLIWWFTSHLLYEYYCSYYYFVLRYFDLEWFSLSRHLEFCCSKHKKLPKKLILKLKWSHIMSRFQDFGCKRYDKVLWWCGCLLFGQTGILMFWVTNSCFLISFVIGLSLWLLCGLQQLVLLVGFRVQVCIGSGGMSSSKGFLLSIFLV